MKKVAPLLALALASAALVACGGGGGGTTTTETGGEGTTAGGGSTLKFEADPSGQLSYTTTEVTTTPGKKTLELVNPQPLPHDIRIEDSSGKIVGQTAVITESEDTGTANLKPGTYTFFCSVPGHRQAGMEGTLKVK